MTDPREVLGPGGEAEGEGVRAHIAAMNELNPAPLAGTPPKSDETPQEKGSAKNSSTLPKNWKRIPDSELKSMTKKLGAPSYKHGTPRVPKTGLALLHEGEAVIPKNDNPNAVEKAAGYGKDEGMADHSPEEKAHFHRAMAHLNQGGLHRHFGIPEGQPIPMEKKQEAANSDNPHVKKMGVLAVAMHSWKRGAKKKC